MFIQVQDTPNPNTLKFLPGVTLLEGNNTITINPSNLEDSPLAKAIFEIDGIEQVFIASDFISVTKKEEQDWDLLRTRILAAIMDHLVAGLPIVEGEQAKYSMQGQQEEMYEVNEEDKELVAQIKELIDTRVRPAVAQDGGDIIFKGFRDGIVYLELHGACSGCPSSTITLKSGIENMLKHYVPEVSSVEAV